MVCQYKLLLFSYLKKKWMQRSPARRPSSHAFPFLQAGMEITVVVRNLYSGYLHFLEGTKLPQPNGSFAGARFQLRGEVFVYFQAVAVRSKAKAWA